MRNAPPPNLESSSPIPCEAIPIEFQLAFMHEGVQRSVGNDESMVRRIVGEDEPTGDVALTRSLRLEVPPPVQLVERSRFVTAGTRAGRGASSEQDRCDEGETYTHRTAP